MSSSNILFEDIFNINDIDPNGKKFDRVSRLICKSENYEMDLTLDLNTEIYPVDINHKFTLVLAKSLNADGSPDAGFYDPTNKPSLLDEYEYAMYGKVYKYSEDTKLKKVSVYVSYGGLLMLLQGDPRNVSGLELDSRIYLLLRKIQKK
eukprot:TRINITY_DN6773_c0_g1_i1.p1 TRINITY_DN6773_c0_g1~~TRINITY_DN6773_c0_g1_i1.p1  ORF type:complete len:163 (+),score=40.46 TRINITY_DN6773_c0_g1_i1:44-490(+)